MSHFKDCEYFKIWDENGHLYMNGTHHDGTHSIEIKKVTQNGEKYYDNWNFKPFDKRTLQTVHRKMFEDSHYTHLIHYAHNIYGCPKREGDKN